MRNLKLQVQMSIDGYIAGINGEMDWMVFNWDDELKKYVEKLTEPVDCIILGRKLAEGFIPYWNSVASNPDDPEHSSGRKFSDTPKVVFTKTLETSAWENTVLAKGDLVEEVTRLKNKEGKDIIAYGGAAFVSALIKHGLVDSFHLFINPTVLGKGMSIFKEIEGTKNMSLIKATSYDCGIVVLNYEPKL